MTSPTRAHAAVGTALLHRVIDLARLAPSVHNTQPWAWRIVADEQATGALVELYADHSRSLPAADPESRNLMISCGTALHHTLVAARALGLDSSAERMPAGPRSALVARIHLRRGAVPDSAADDLAAIRDRFTDRRRFTSWPVPQARLQNLARGVATDSGALAVPVVDVSLRFRIELLLERARLQQATDPAIVAEAAHWIHEGGVDGMPPGALPELAGTAGERPHRFRGGRSAPAPNRALQSSDGLLVLATPIDGPLAWVVTGEALSALWLRATLDGLSVVPLSQVVEEPATRAELGRELFAEGDYPQLLVRIGWQEISRSTLPRTPRRPLHDVLRA